MLQCCDYLVDEGVQIGNHGVLYRLEVLSPALRLVTIDSGNKAQSPSPGTLAVPLIITVNLGSSSASYPTSLRYAIDGMKKSITEWHHPGRDGCDPLPQEGIYNTTQELRSNKPHLNESMP